VDFEGGLVSVSMPIVAARESYFETGLEILADTGFGGLKLAEVCRRLGVTSGSFYHYFTNWGTYTKELTEYWRQDRTVRMAQLVRAQPSPRKRLEAAIAVALMLPHGAEAAIRSWSSVDADVLAVQREVDQQRYDVIYESALEIAPNPTQAGIYSSWAIHLFIGYEQSTLPKDLRMFEWIFSTMLDDLEAGRFVDVPT